MEQINEQLQEMLSHISERNLNFKEFEFYYDLVKRIVEENLIDLPITYVDALLQAEVNYTDMDEAYDCMVKRQYLKDVIKPSLEKEENELNDNVI